MLILPHTGSFLGNLYSAMATIAEGQGYNAIQGHGGFRVTGSRESNAWPFPNLIECNSSRVLIGDWGETPMDDIGRCQ